MHGSSASQVLFLPHTTFIGATEHGCAALGASALHRGIILALRDDDVANRLGCEKDSLILGEHT
jgi:hypothetical protein